MRRIRSLHLVAVVCGLGAIAACGSAELTTPFTGEDAGSSNTGGTSNRDAGGGFMIGTKDASVQDEPAPVTPEDDAPGIGLCGDGTLQPGEQCDDGNARPGDGCSGICVVEVGYTCPNPGDACIYGGVVAVCGDGNINNPEA